MKRICFAFYLILPVLLTSCTKDEQTSTDEFLVPLKIGNEWQYETIIYNENESVSSSTTTNMTILRDTSINGKIYFSDGLTYYRNVDKNTVEASINGSVFYTYFKRTNQDQMKVQTGVGQLDNCIAYDTLKAFNQLTSINGYESVRNEFELTNCYGIKLKTVSYLKPGVGITKVLHYLRNSNTGNLYLRFKQELKSYKLK
jgi:hypothetical protein